jgi:hypothetical protein
MALPAQAGKSARWLTDACNRLRLCGNIATPENGLCELVADEWARAVERYANEPPK